VSQSLYTTVAPKFLSCIVTQLIQSLLKEINQDVLSWNIQAHCATELQSYNVVQLQVGTSDVFLKQRIEYPIARDGWLSTAQ
jgi:hypothetical protein